MIYGTCGTKVLNLFIGLHATKVKGLTPNSLGKMEKSGRGEYLEMMICKV